MEDLKRRFNHRFLCLPYIWRLKFALKHGLIDDSDEDLTHIAANKLIVERAFNSSEIALIKVSSLTRIIATVQL